MPGSPIDEHKIYEFVCASYRTALLNRKYYLQKLQHYRNCNFWVEVAIAIGATGSGGIASLALWTTTVQGQHIWQLIVVVAAVLGVVKPFLALGKEIEKHSRLLVGHTSIYFDLKHLIEDVKSSKKIPDDIVDRYNGIRGRIAEFGGLDDRRSDKRLLERLEEEVNKEIPPESLALKLS